MNNIKKGAGSEGLNEKKAYEPPKAIRLGDMCDGEGRMCTSSGSGDSNCDTTGNSASLLCRTGNSGPNDG